MDFNDPRWKSTADALGMSVEDLLTAMSYETGGTMDPMQKGPTTKWGQHQGLIQFGEPQAREYGVDFSSPEAALDTQLGPDGAVVQYMNAHGFRPGEHGFMDFYSTINAGSPGRYNASDAAAGGAAGTVRDKVTNQMTGHRENAQRWLNGGEGPTKRPNRAGVSTQMAGLNDRARQNSAAPVDNEEEMRRKRLGAAGNMLASLSDDIMAGRYF